MLARRYMPMYMYDFGDRAVLYNKPIYIPCTRHTPGVWFDLYLRSIYWVPLPQQQGEGHSERTEAASPPFARGTPGARYT